MPRSFPRNAMSPGANAHDASASWVRVWPAWQRLLHWLLAAAIIVALVTFEGGRVHEIAGYAALGAALLRIGLGLAGPREARFNAFVRGPSPTFAYAVALLRGHPPRHLNHTPLGAWMIVALLALGLVGAGSGALYVTNRFWGESWVIELHAIAAWPLAALVPLHVLGVIHASRIHHENLLRAMIDGRKRVDGGAADQTQ
jgi:cytochrome b